MFKKIICELLKGWNLVFEAINLMFGIAIIPMYGTISKFIIEHNIVQNKWIMSIILTLFISSIFLNIIFIKEITKLFPYCHPYTKVKNALHDKNDDKLILYADSHPAFQVNQLTTIYIDKDPKVFPKTKAEVDMFVGEIENITESGYIQIKVHKKIFATSEDLDNLKKGNRDCHTDLNVRLSASYNNIKNLKGV